MALADISKVSRTEAYRREIDSIAAFSRRATDFSARSFLALLHFPRTFSLFQKYKFTNIQHIRSLLLLLPPPRIKSALRIQTFNKFTCALRDRVNADEKRATLLSGWHNFTRFTRYCLNTTYTIHGYLLAAD